MANEYWLTDEQWRAIERLTPTGRRGGGQAWPQSRGHQRNRSCAQVRLSLTGLS
jgi:hypothetical protein